MLGSFQILDHGEPRRSPEGKPLFWRGVFHRAEAEIVPGSWDVAGLRGTGSFDWTVDDVFLPERRTTPHVGMPLDNQWSRWPGLTYQSPAVCWVGPHHSAVITGIARAGIDALIDLAGGKTPRGRTGLLCDNPQVQDAVGGPTPSSMPAAPTAPRCSPRRWNTVASGQCDDARTARPLPAGFDLCRSTARAQAMELVYRHGGSTSFKRESRLAECWRDLHTRRPDRDDRAGMVSDRRPRLSRDRRRPAPTLEQDRVGRDHLTRKSSSRVQTVAPTPPPASAGGPRRASAV